MAYLHPLGNRWKSSLAEPRKAGFGTLRQQITHTSLRQARAIHERSLALTALVLINDWPASIRQARIVAADLRTLTVLLGFYRDVCADTGASHDPEVIAQYRRESQLLLVQLSGIELEQNNLALSDWLEYNVAPWTSSMATNLQGMG